MEKRKFSVKFIFDEGKGEYTYFHEWYNNVCKKGFYAFRFVNIDDSTKSTFAIYRFVVDTAPSYTDLGGGKIECTMEWEEA